MPKLTKVKETKNSMEWEDITLLDQNGSNSVIIPRRSLKKFLDNGYKVKKVHIEFEKV